MPQCRGGPSCRWQLLRSANGIRFRRSRIARIVHGTSAALSCSLCAPRRTPPHPAAQPIGCRMWHALGCRAREVYHGAWHGMARHGMRWILRRGRRRVLTCSRAHVGTRWRRGSSSKRRSRSRITTPRCARVPSKMLQPSYPHVARAVRDLLYEYNEVAPNSLAACAHAHAHATACHRTLPCACVRMCACMGRAKPSATRRQGLRWSRWKHGCVQRCAT